MKIQTYIPSELNFSISNTKLCKIHGISRKKMKKLRLIYAPNTVRTQINSTYEHGFKCFDSEKCNCQIGKFADKLRKNYHRRFRKCLKRHEMDHFANKYYIEYYAITKYGSKKIFFQKIYDEIGEFKENYENQKFEHVV